MMSTVFREFDSQGGSLATRRVLAGMKMYDFRIGEFNASVNHLYIYIYMYIYMVMCLCVTDSQTQWGVMIRTDVCSKQLSICTHFLSRLETTQM